ncbi:MAG: Tetratricopeptide repeat [Actinomycetota bacterium]|jgi:Flp pilus assembly protein TadD|nr:Tetratricopeptide repeat [Actinomycetota bacterium]
MTSTTERSPGSEEDRQTYVADLLSSVEELSEAGDHRSALQLLNRARTAFPPNAQVETARGWSLENLGPEHLGAAGDAYAEALRLDPDVLAAREGLGNVLFGTGDKRGANQLYREVIERVDGMTDAPADALELQGWCLYKLNDYGRAVEVLHTAVAKDGTLVAIRFDLGLALLAKGEVGRAVAEYGAAIAQLRALTPSRRIGALMVALEDLDAGIAGRPSVRRNYAATEMRSRLAWELSEATAAKTSADPPADPDLDTAG